MNIDNSIIAIEKLIPFFDKKKLSISTVNVAWHLDHSLKVINNVCEALSISKPENYKSTSSFIKSYVLITGTIPRGKAKAPKNVIEKGVVTKESIEKQLVEAKKHLNKIKKLPAKSHFTHPYFGMLPLKTSLRFLAIHTNHHLKIVKAILKES